MVQQPASKRSIRQERCRGRCRLSGHIGSASNAETGKPASDLSHIIALQAGRMVLGRGEVRLEAFSSLPGEAWG